MCAYVVPYWNSEKNLIETVKMPAILNGSYLVAYSTKHIELYKYFRFQFSVKAYQPYDDK